MTKYLNDQIDAILAGDAGLRRGDDPIHDTRVAIRRLRSTLRVFRQLFHGTVVEPFDEDLKWFAALLGEVRDCQVQERRFDEALDELPVELVLGPVRSRIRSDLQAVGYPARQRVTEAMETPRYRDLLVTLRAWHARPPIDADTTTKALRKRAKRADRKADRRLVTALKTEDGALLHRARKAAKRARYSSELLSEAKPSEKRTAKHYKKIQSALGDHQDTVVATDLLRRMGAAAGTTGGENGFTFGLLYAREQRIARRSRSNAAALAA